MKTDITKPLALKAALKSHPDRTPVEVSDTVVRGLSARVRRIDGVPVGQWNCRVTIGGRTKRISLGDVQQVTGSQARLAAIQARENAKSGKEVVSASTAARQAQKAAQKLSHAEAKALTSLNDLIYKTIRDKGGKIIRQSYYELKWSKMKSGQDAENGVKNLMGETMDEPVHTLTKERLESIYLTKADTAPHAAARGFAYLRPVLLHFMLRNEGIPRDALDLVQQHLKPMSRGGTYQKAERSRVIAPDEWSCIWKAAPDTPAGHAMRLLMATGMRNREACELKHHEVDLDNRCINLESARTKNGQPFRVFLNDMAVEAITAATDLKAQRGLETPYVFSNDEGPVWLGDKNKRAIQKASGTSGWIFHDFRRAITTHLGEAGVDDSVVDLMLNHKASGTKGGVAGTYNKSDKVTQRRAAIAKWNDITVQWIDGTSAKIVKLK